MTKTSQMKSISSTFNLTTRIRKERSMVLKHKCLCFLLVFMAYSTFDPIFFRILEGFIPMEKCHLLKGFKLKPGNHADNFLDYCYLDLYLERFLLSADEHFMPGFPVIYYVFVDDLAKLKQITPKLSGRGKVQDLKVEKHRRWQDNSMFRMKLIKELIETHVKNEANYIFCFDVDQHFNGRFGTEALSESVALLHAWFYRKLKFFYTYESNPLSSAYIESKGDFYYHAAVFGGTWQSVRNLTERCHHGIMKDKQRNVEALWHDESHLNKYYWLHKPTKILSPEYCWDKKIGWRRDIHVFRLLWVKKQYGISRQIN
ncbi:N-acetyllactosaminide alpha-1,3-galactosyltransferase-like isoform X3 [Narcine bancroftii]|uniref:N-acetyllactosaminide alpha-1,3-galactosyltransferase-like isoform X3 n=1 Tax=Narcine bancroftii TaxID=1343680 RepID=UPI003831345F